MVVNEPSDVHASRQDPLFSLQYHPWLRSILRLIPGGRDRPAVAVSAEDVHVRMHPGGEIQIPRDSIIRVWRTKTHDQGLWFWLPPVLCPHSNLQGTWWLNGSMDNLVAIDIDPPASGHIWGLPVKPKRLVVSLEDPEGFLAEVLG